MAKKKPEPKTEETTEKKIPEGYAEVTPEMLAELVGGGIQTVMNIGLGEKLVLEDMQDRIMYLDGEVNSDVLHTIIMQIYKLNGVDVGLEPEDMQPIILIINSGGGSVMDGLALCDAINASRVPVIAICIGYAYSMAFNIFTQCDLRLATKNASFLYHDGWTCDSNVSSKVKDAAKFYDKVDERVNKLIANKTKLTADYLSSIARADTYWFADEGKENGFVDAIIGEDIDIAEIFGFMGDIPCECDHDKCDCKK